MSVKLLDFKPHTTFRDYFDEDIWCSCTSDLPELRYQETIPVFLWDKLRFKMELMKKFNLSESDVELSESLAVTKNSFIPFINEGSARVPYELPSSNTWAANLSGLDENLKALQVGGAVYNLSVRAIQALDVHYANEAIRQRVKIPIIKRTGKGELMAYAYVLKSTAFTKYNPHEKTFSLVNGFKPKPCSTLNPSYHSTEIYQQMYRDKTP